jgi:hypothetical protein
MGRGVVSQRFCCVCGTEHDVPATCPGELRATGAERPGWRVHVETPFGQEAIGVLLAPSHDQWRARIVTYPNVLWTAPGGRGTLKFVGDTLEEAEARAIVFVEQHVRARRYVRRDGLAPVGGGAPKPAARAESPAFAAARRNSRCLPVRFGLDRAITRGVTVNLSAEGMFVSVLNPEDGGRVLLIHVDLDGHTLALRGLVMWNRRRAERERPAGMGILLSDPPTLYQSLIAALP